MFESVRTFRDKLEKGETCFGAGITLADSAIVEALAPLVHFVWIDLEHSHLSFETVHTHLMAARAASTPALVRARSTEIAQIKPLLDIGVDGLIVPQVRTADEVRCIVKHCRYAPQGERGYGPRRAADYGTLSGIEAMHMANELLFVAVQIENGDALRELDEIASIEGVDSLALGPFDLALSLGHGDNLDHPEVLSALRRIVEAARRAGKYIGSGVGTSPTQARTLLELGVQWLQSGDDYRYMIDALQRLKTAVLDSPLVGRSQQDTTRG